MRLKKWFIWLWMTFIGFPDILGGNRVKLLEFGGHHSKFGRACIVQTQGSRKSILFTWIMNKLVYKRFLDEMMQFGTFNSHRQPSPEIWFETEHFENLGFLGLGLRVPPITSWAWNGSREKLSWILGIFKV